MGLFDKVKNFINASEEEYVEDANTDGTGLYEPRRQTADGYSYGSTPAYSAPLREKDGKVVDIRPHVVFKKLDRFEDVGGVADVLNEKRIVVLNLETCPPDISRRVIDFLYGVAYANSGEIKRIAGKAYVITPYNVPVTGELLDEMDNPGFGLHF